MHRSSKFIFMVGSAILLSLCIYLISAPQNIVHAQTIPSFFLFSVVEASSTISASSPVSSSIDPTILSVTLASVAAIFTSIIAGIFVIYQTRKTASLQKELESKAREQQLELLEAQKKTDERDLRTTVEIQNSASTLIAFQKSFEKSSKLTQDSVRELSKLAPLLQDIIIPLNSLKQEIHAIRQPLNSPLPRIELIDTPGTTIHIHQDKMNSDISDKLMMYHQVSSEYSHIIATPLASIDAAISNIQERFITLFQSDGDSSNNSKILLSFLENAAISIESIKSILQHGAGFLPGDAERFSMNMIVRKAIRMTSTTSSDRIEPSVSLQTVPEIKYYPANLLIALIQILENAYEALRHGGTININGRYDVSSKKISLLISNNGDPIPPDVQLRIFESDFSTKANGRGSGLAIARRCLETIRGSVDLHSSNSDQTTFKLSFYPIEIYDQARS